jgi:DNA-binding MarR family transcriptional regulator
LPDPNDLRAVRVAVTPAGELVHGRIRERRTRVLFECLEQLPEEAADQLLELVPALETLAEALKKIPTTER